MELVIKLYQDKSSKIGIKYNYEYQAVKAYEDLLNKNQELAFYIKFELVKDKINLELISEQTGSRTLYKELAFRPDQLKRLKAFVKPGSDLDFVHVFSKENTMMIAKPFRTKRFITIKNYEMVGPENFTSLL